MQKLLTITNQKRPNHVIYVKCCKIRDITDDLNDLQVGRVK